MRTHVRTTLALMLLIAAALPSVAQTGKIETLGPLGDPAVPESIRQALAANGYRIALAETGAATEIWFRKEIPAQPKNPAADAVYDRIPESTLVGLVHFSRSFNDYRGQSVPAGFYTLRYALMPNDGNHLGVAPSRDFLLLIPASADPGPQTMPKFQELVALSRQAAGTKHPAPMSLVPAEGLGVPAISRNDESNSVFSCAVRLASGEEMPLAMVVKGTAPQ